MATQAEIVAAYIVDRAHQYNASSGIHNALLELAQKVYEGEAEEAHRHGELDDLITKMAKRTRRRK